MILVLLWCALAVLAALLLGRILGGGSKPNHREGPWFDSDKFEHRNRR